MKKRTREHFIIDGYNVINAWPQLIALRDNLSYARDQLIAAMAEYGAYEGYDVTIVFDALFTVQEETKEQVNEHLVVIYTGEGETADSYIRDKPWQSVSAAAAVGIFIGILLGCRR